jgi:hypothetical protein
MTIQTTYHLEVLPHVACAPGEATAKTPAAASSFRFEAWPTEQRLITQPFGADPLHYAPFGLAGHEGGTLRRSKDAPSLPARFETSPRFVISCAM